MKAHDKSVVHSSADSNWRTPAALFAALDSFFHFTLDAAADQHNHLVWNWIGPGTGDPKTSDALTCDWLYAADSVRPVAFLNPPYSREHGIHIAPFVQAASVWGDRMTVVALLPAAVQSRWWAAHVQQADEIWFLKHRVNFEASPAMLKAMNAKRKKQGKPAIKAAWNAGVNSAVVVWRPWGFRGQGPAHRYWSYR